MGWDIAMGSTDVYFCECDLYRLADLPGMSGGADGLFFFFL